MASRYFNNSEGCICAKRFLVAESLFDDFTKAFVEQSKALPMGDPMKEGIKLGPLARSDLRKNLDRQVLDAVKAGARILTGGEIPAGPGNFYPATVLVGLPPEAAIAKEEFFGPVAMIFPFKTEEEAIRIANITDFGLSAAVWSRDLVRARRVAGEIGEVRNGIRSMTSPAPIPAHRSEASRRQAMGANLALPAQWNLPTQK